MNEYTEAEIERAARILCDRWFENETKYAMRPQIQMAISMFVRRRDDIESALKQAKEQK